MSFLTSLFGSKPPSDGGVALVDALDPKLVEQVKLMQTRFRHQLAAEKKGRFSPEFRMDTAEANDLDIRVREALMGSRLVRH